MNAELKKLHAEYKFRVEQHRNLSQLIELTNREMERLQSEKKKFYLPPPPPYDLPKELMAPNDWATLLKMKRSDDPCDFCGGETVRVGKKFDLCQDCRHCKLKNPKTDSLARTS